MKRMRRHPPLWFPVALLVVVQVLFMTLEGLSGKGSTGVSTEATSAGEGKGRR